MDKKSLWLTPVQIEFLKSRTSDYKTMMVGYLGGLDRQAFQMYLQIMKLIEPDYVGTAWCDDCCFKMAEKVWKVFHSHVYPAQEAVAEVVEPALSLEQAAETFTGILTPETPATMPTPADSPKTEVIKPTEQKPPRRNRKPKAE